MNKQTNKQVKLYSLKETHFRSKDTHKLKGKKESKSDYSNIWQNRC